jgi:hypothetical protein
MAFAWHHSTVEYSPATQNENSPAQPSHFPSNITVYQRAAEAGAKHLLL